MRVPSHIISLFVLLTLILSSCQPTPVTPRVPEVVERVGVNVLGGSRAVAVNPSTGDVYIAASHHITILRGSQILGEAELTGAEIRSIAVDEAHGLLYVVNELGDSVTVLRGTKILGVVPTVGKSPRSVAVEPHSHLTYIVSPYQSRPLREIEGNILVISETQVIDNLKLNDVAPLHVVADPVGGYVYAGGGRRVVVVQGLREIASIDIGNVDSMDTNPRTGDVYALTGETLHRFKDGKLIDSVFLSSEMGNVADICVNSVTGAVYIPHTGYVLGEGRVLVVQNMKVIADIKVDGLATLAADPFTGNVYAASFLGAGNLDNVAVINETRILGTIKLGGFPTHMGVNPNNGWVYIVSDSGSGVTILGYPSDVRETPVLSRTPTPSPISPEPSRVYP